MSSVQVARVAPRVIGAANAVTAARAVLIGVVAVPILARLGPSGPVTGHLPWWITGALVGALVLDGVDGAVARRTHTESSFGARFDMEVDAALIMLLCLPAARLLGAWVLLIGAARYVWLVLVALAPRLGTPIPVRRWRKSVAVAQAIALLAALCGLLPTPAATWLVAAALAALVASFGTQAVEALRSSQPTASGRTAVRRAAAISALWLAATWPIGGWPSLGSTLRLPVEGLAIVAVLALWPRRGRIVAVIGGVLVTLVMVTRLLDAGFTVALARPLDLPTDLRYATDAFGLLRAVVGPWLAAAIIAAGLLGLAALTLGLCRAMLSVATLVRAAKPGRHGIVAAAAAIWVVLWVGGISAVTGQPLASHAAYDVIAGHVQQWRTNASEARAFDEHIAQDPLAHAAAGTLLHGLSGKDVLVIFVESYGRVAVQDSNVARGVSTTLDDATKTLAAQGFSARSGFLTSTTFGGLSWLAHASVQTGLPVTSQARYDQLLSSGHSTLTGLFAAAGWHTACVDPANRTPWPPARDFYHCDDVLDAHTLGYHGPALGYPPVPDQFTLASFARAELAPGHAPVMAQIDLVTSHAPWSPVPPMLAWDDLGDGSIYAHRPLAQVRDIGSPTAESAGYGRAISYSINAVTDFLTHVDDPNLVVVMLGDHQPNALVSGDGAGHDVPISLITKDARVIDRISSWGWGAGLQPAREAPLWPMADFRGRFVAAFGD